jgi:hypothetical protein
MASIALCVVRLVQDTLKSILILRRTYSSQGNRILGSGFKADLLLATAAQELPMSAGSIVEDFSDLPDPRTQRAKHHSLLNICD